MLKATRTCFVALVFHAIAWADGTTRASLPSSIVADLNQRLPGWSLTLVEPEAVAFLKEYRPGQLPNVITGDFDGNKIKDYAVFVSSPKIDEDYIYAYLQSDDGTYEAVDVAMFFRSGSRYLVLHKKGSQDSSLHDTDLIYDNDSIGCDAYEMSGTVFVFRKGKFESISTGD